MTQAKTRGRPKRPQENPRDPETVRAILAAKAQGISMTEIGRRYGMTRQGVSYICERWGEAQ